MGEILYIFTILICIYAGIEFLKDDIITINIMGIVMLFLGFSLGITMFNV